MTSGVAATLHSDDGHRCVKIIKCPDGTFGLREFRRDPEDAGGWTVVRELSRGTFATQGQALAAAKDHVAWLREPQDEALERGRSMVKAVVSSLHNDDVNRCVDIIAHPDGTFGFKEFRRDPEDGGGWTLVSHNPKAVYASSELATAAARAQVAWLREEPA